jgi:hypothetical protein
MQIVNGYVCQNCTDVENAKKYVDPSHPRQTPATGGASPPNATITAEAVTFGGALSKVADTRRDSDPAETRPPAPDRVDIRA